MTEHTATLSGEDLQYLPGGSTAEKRALARWYAAARAALARNRPLTTSTTPPADRHAAGELSAAELSALHDVGAFKEKALVDATQDPLLRSQAQYMAILEESLSRRHPGAPATA